MRNRNPQPQSTRERPPMRTYSSPRTSSSSPPSSTLSPVLSAERYRRHQAQRRFRRTRCRPTCGRRHQPIRSSPGSGKRGRSDRRSRHWHRRSSTPSGRVSLRRPRSRVPAGGRWRCISAGASRHVSTVRARGRHGSADTRTSISSRPGFARSRRSLLPGARGRTAGRDRRRGHAA